MAVSSHGVQSGKTHEFARLDSPAEPRQGRSKIITGIATKDPDHAAETAAGVPFGDRLGQHRGQGRGGVSPQVPGAGAGGSAGGL